MVDIIGNNLRIGHNIVAGKSISNMVGHSIDNAIDNAEECCKHQEFASHTSRVLRCGTTLTCEPANNTPAKPWPGTHATPAHSIHAMKSRPGRRRTRWW